MTQSKFTPDESETSELATIRRTRRRRDARAKRRSKWMLIGGIAVLALLIGLPSLISHSSIGQSILASSLRQYELDAKSQRVRMGWLTPLRIDDLIVVGRTERSELVVDQIDVDYTLMDLIRGRSPSKLVTLRGVQLACEISSGRSSIEDDLDLLLSQPSRNDSTTAGQFQIAELEVIVTDADRNQSWTLSQTNATIDLLSNRIQGTFAGVLIEPTGNSGAWQGSVEWFQSTAGQDALPKSQWRLSFNTESLPLSVASLARKRFQESAGVIPQELTGDISGAVVISGATPGNSEARFDQVTIRNLQASDLDSETQQLSAVWSNESASLDGELLLTEERLFGKRLVSNTDFGELSFDGSLARNVSFTSTDDNPLRWLGQIDGVARAQIDLPSLQSALPKALPLRNDAKLISGSITARVESLPNQQRGTPRRSLMEVRSSPIGATSRGQQITIDPVLFTAIVAGDDRNVAANSSGAISNIRTEQFEWQSKFARAVGSGDLRNGNARIDIDFDRLMGIVRPIVDLDTFDLTGQAEGNIQWTTDPNQVWRISGDADAKNLSIVYGDNTAIKRKQVSVNLDAVGRLSQDRLSFLDQANVLLRSDSLQFKADLLQPQTNPSFGTPTPWRVSASGALPDLESIARDWLPSDVQQFAGTFDVVASGVFSAKESLIDNATIELVEPSFLASGSVLRQPNLTLSFTGLWNLNNNSINAQQCTVIGDAFSASMVGQSSEDGMQANIGWRAKLERLQQSASPKFATRTAAKLQPTGAERTETRQQGTQQPATGQPATGQPATGQLGGPVDTESFFRTVGFRQGIRRIAQDQWGILGDCEGELRIEVLDGAVSIQHRTSGINIAIVQPTATGNNPQENRVVWFEPNLGVDGTANTTVQFQDVKFSPTRLTGDWFDSTLEGVWELDSELGEQIIQLTGPAQIDMEPVAKRLGETLGQAVYLQGIHQTPIEINGSISKNGDFGMLVRTSLGWEQGEIASVSLGPSNIPLTVTPTSTLFEQAEIRVGSGMIRGDGEVNYATDRTWMRLKPGVTAESIAMTPDMTDRWMKYLAPVAANAARVEGRFSARLENCYVDFEDPSVSEVQGRLQIDYAEMTAGPLAQSVMSSVKQIQSLAGSLSAKALSTGSLPGGSTAQDNASTLISMPGQQVDFAVWNGVVSHNRMFFEIDRAQLVTSGNVSFDGRLDMTAQMPLDARWLGSDLQSLAGQNVTLPIDGTLSQPSLDSRGVSRIVSEFGAKAIQQTAESYLQKQLGRGLERILGR